MEIIVKKTKDGNPICDMDEILHTAKQRLNGSVVNGLRVRQEYYDDVVVFKINAE